MRARCRSVGRRAVCPGRRIESSCVTRSVARCGVVSVIDGRPEKAARLGPQLRVQPIETIGSFKRGFLLLSAVFCLLVSAGLPHVPAQAFAAPVAPHVAQGPTTDACAMCHRAHTANTPVPHRAVDSTITTGTSLIASAETSRGDVPLCLNCHGVGQLGSNTDVESAFALSSVHSLAPSASPYGTSPMMCSTCHDSHGSDRTAGGAPYPALLRAYEGTQPVFTAEDYCATCHKARVDEVFAGLGVFRRTSHYTGMPAPASGTDIRCSICHDPHGSKVAPLLAAQLVPTSVPTTVAVTADDRTFCLACHRLSEATWSGDASYGVSAHAISTATVAVAAKWVPAGVRRVGECQVCHAAMGRSEGGGLTPKLLWERGRGLCDRCHAPDGVASTDASSEAYPASESAALELVAVYAPSSETSADGVVSVYGRALSGAAPRPLIGPRQYVPALGSGPAAAGDINGDGAQELVVASARLANVTIYATDPLTGLSLAPTTTPVPAGVRVSSIAVANVVANGVGWIVDTPEIPVVTSDGRLIVYRWTGSVLAQVGEPVVLPAGPWAMATGDVTGTAHAEVIVTSAGGGGVTVAGDDGLGGITSTTTSVGVSPVAPAVGRVWSDAQAGEQQIIVGDSRSATCTVRVLDPSCAELAGYDVVSGDGKPVATTVGDIWPAVPSAGIAEVAIGFADASGDSSIVVVPQRGSGPGLDTAAAVQRSTGDGADTTSLLVGDVEGDGLNELIAGNGGRWARSSAVAPSVQVWRGDGAGLTLGASHVGGGTEMAGSAPALVLADFGPVLPSRHPIDELATAAHVSTETAPFERHVTCSDCHDSHEATSSASVAPAVDGLLKGARGVEVTYTAGMPSFAPPARSATTYGICFKCHSSYSALAGRPDLAVAFDPANASVHAVEAPSGSADVAAATFVAGSGFSSSSVLTCTDCHGDDGRSGAQARGVHTSASAPILGRPYLGTVPADPAGLCYACHRVDVYASGVADGSGMSGFLAAGGTERLHSLHVKAPAAGGHGLSCGACHVTHGSATQPHLLRGDIGLSGGAGHSGSCTNACHDPAIAGGARTWGL